MSDAESNFSFPSPSISPTFSFEQPTWSVVAEGESSTLPLVEAEADETVQARRSNEGEGDEINLNAMTRRASTHNGSTIEASEARSSSGDHANGAHHQQRGRTHRKRSSATQPYVCVVVWLVRLPKHDPAAQIALEQVQEIRRKYDNAYRRWEPHITLVPPFVVPFKQNTDSGTWIDEVPGGVQASAKVKQSRETAAANVHPDDDHVRRLADPRKVLSELSKRIARICDEQVGTGAEPLQVAFEEVSKFALRRYDTFHLRPSPATPGTEALAKLQRFLAQALPEAWEFSRGAYGRRPSRGDAQQQQNGNVNKSAASAKVTAAEHLRSPTDFNPHLTLGQAFTAEKGAEIEAQALALLDSNNGGGGGPLSVPLDAIQLMWKPVSQSGPYEVFQEFTLSNMKSNDNHV